MALDQKADSARDDHSEEEEDEHETDEEPKDAEVIGGNEPDNKEQQKEKEKKKVRKGKKQKIKAKPRSRFREPDYPWIVYSGGDSSIVDFPGLRFAGRDALDECYIVADDEWIPMPEGW